MSTLNQIRHDGEPLCPSAPMPPTQSLPPLRNLDTSSREQINFSLRNLKLIYFPSPSLAVPGPKPDEEALSSLPNLGVKKLLNHRRKFRRPAIPDSGYASAEEDGEDEKKPGPSLPSEAYVDFLHHDLDRIREDAYEREFVIKWLIGLIARSDAWMTADEESEEEARVLDEAVELLAAFHAAGVEGDDDGEEEAGRNEEDGALVREFVFHLGQTSAPIREEGELKTEVHVRLNDLPPSRDDHTSVGLQIWGSCILLGERICADPERFLLFSQPRTTISSELSSSNLYSGSGPCPERPRIRILELGAGTGMLSIVCAEILRGWSEPGEVVATDYHPEVLRNLEGNVGMNLHGKDGQTVTTTISHLDWEDPSSYDEGSFDIILAADVVYQPQHARWIKGVVERMLVKPLICSGSTQRGGTFWLFIPIRTTGRHEGLVDTVGELFRSVGTFPELGILECQEIARKSGIGRADEDGYRLFRIGWVTSR